ncbi:MAG: hypothetical protein AAFY36_14850 [Bacteroidota bacterium]
MKQGLNNGQTILGMVNIIVSDQPFCAMGADIEAKTLRKLALSKAA